MAGSRIIKGSVLTAVICHDPIGVCPAGVDAFTAIFALMHASCNHTVLQSACVRLLTSPTLLQKVALSKDEEVSSSP